MPIEGPHQICLSLGTDPCYGRIVHLSEPPGRPEDSTADVEFPDSIAQVGQGIGREGTNIQSQGLGT